MALSSAHAIYFFNLRGDILIERRYRDDVTRDVAENFRTQILNSKDSSAIQTPVRTLGSCTFMHLRHADVYILCISKNNPNVMLAFSFMTSLVSLFKSYFGGDLNEANIQNNFVLIYELLDEAMDFGLPQITDPTILKSLIFQKGSSIDFFEKKKEKADPNATLQVTGAVSWRKEGIKYKKNEVFLDLVEQVNLLMSSNGTILTSDVQGRIMMKCLLSDMPELRVGLNDKVEDATFHQCVNLSTYEAQKVITFVPPDGEFELMKYRCHDGVSLPFKVLPVINEMGRTRLEVNVQIKAAFSSKIYGINMTILVPVPDNTAKANLLVTNGKAKYDATKKALVWKISKFMGESDHSLRAEVTLVATTKEKKPWVRPPISMQFQVPMLSASSVRVAYLKILERKMGSEYHVDKWVRKVVKSGEYIIRT
ncbi:hypothetical protein CEUSTIGMA_g13637.t1 [Chlamydomonas eustigma]|uniref:MHD domain-containing protein n=1 Tax=Chlamydomonas eustigma TaxID=1157962 RepID=A0A250XT31_9CHLO|nr:hypothetical protein CEUSTIGMA_g13637.t1 [Chlamydomonas eustigma]|eukprot:GAX86224.1 hypothetical protein CEUSTIGMA_g13637.t1 [Chlamydomonas eustigma]